MTIGPKSLFQNVLERLLLYFFYCNAIEKPICNLLQSNEL